MNQQQRDPRLDRIVSWALSGVSAVAFTVGAWFFSSLDGSVRGLRAEIGSLRERIAVLQVSQEGMRDVKADLRELRERLRALETGQGERK